MESTAEKRPTQLSSHSNVRQGLSDYNDGCGLSHHLGNDDYADGANLPDDPEEIEFDGSIALGNELMEVLD